MLFWQPDNQGESSDKTADDDVECEDSYCAGYARNVGRAVSIVPTGNIKPVSSRNVPIPR